MPDSVISGLERSARGFCSNETTVTRTDEGFIKIEVSRLFLWYKSDFTSSLELKASDNEDLKLLAFIRAKMDPAVDVEKCEALDQVLEGSVKFELVFSAYNWSINRK